MTPPFALRSASSTHRGCVRPVNQDAILAGDALGLWAVADGVGGLAKGDVASSTVVEHLAVPNHAKADLRLVARSRLLEANLKIMARAEPRGMAATVAVLGIEGEKYFCLWAGDCRVYRLHDGVLKLLTRDHRMVQELVDAGAIDAAAARNHPRRNVVTRAVGIERDLLLDEIEGAVSAGDVFVLTSDGVTSLCSDSEVASCCGHGDAADAVQSLIDLCLARGAPDNLSVIVLSVATA
jgi:serine/threonine protein phosphatase Stp1